MNIIEHLHSKDIIVGLYTTSEDMTIHTLNNLRSSKEFIEQYYNVHKSDDSIDYLIDYLFLIFVENLPDQSTNSEHQNYSTDDFDYIAAIMKKYSKKKIFDIINNSYKDIFANQSKYYSYGLKYLSIGIIGQYRTQFNEQVIQHIVNEFPEILLDNKTALLQLRKQYENIYEQMFLNTKPFMTLVEPRLEEMLSFLIEIKDKKNDLIEKVSEKLEWYIDVSYGAVINDGIFFVRIKAARIGEFFHAVKYKNYRAFMKKYNKIDKEANQYLQVHGQHSKIEISNEAYEKVARQLDGIGAPIGIKYLYLTHAYEDENILHSSYLENSSLKYKLKWNDFSSTHEKTNDYFTIGRQKMITRGLPKISINLHHWAKPERFSDLIKCMSSTIHDIYSLVGSDIADNEHDIDIADFEQELLHSIMNPDNKHIKAITEICSYFEKVLRTVYIELKEDAHFREDKITLGELLSLNDNPFIDLIGYHHLRWLRFYFITDNEVGLNTRNKISHHRERESLDLTFSGMHKTLWLFISTINSIWINLHKKKSPSE